MGVQRGVRKAHHPSAHTDAIATVNMSFTSRKEPEQDGEKRKHRDNGTQLDERDDVVGDCVQAPLDQRVHG